jgi:DNA mismatch repair protein MutS2
MYADFAHTAEKLEFGQVLEIIAALARSDRSKAVIRALGPFDSPADAERSRREVRELARIREAGETLPLGGWRDSHALVSLSRAEGHLYGGAELVAIAAGESKAAEVRAFLERRREELPLLSASAVRILTHDDFTRRVARTIGRDFDVLDGASQKLARLRGEAASLRAQLRRRLADFTGRIGGGKGYEFVTIRGERYVVSLPRGEAGRVRGIVHQSSGSGASLYVEPMEFVDGNNRLESLLDDERREVTRILLELSAEVFGARDAFLGNQDALRDLDCASAKAEFAGRFRCILPEHGEDAALALLGARHPLLEKRLADEGAERPLRPLDVRCGEDLRVLVISGPNAGGKTVALKTIGLLVVMDRAGLPVPCAEGSILPRYDAVFVDIGDDQSIEASLSTFSSRIARMRDIIERANERSLVLIDEIGDGTDPEEGAALAQAALAHLMERCGRVVVTTHLTALKGWAHDTAGAMNATLDFDPDNLEPLFTLRMGVPGRSWGIDMAGRLGLPRGIIDRARSMIGAETLRLEELLAHLEKAGRIAEAERRELVRKEGVLSELIESYRERLDHIKKDREDLLTRSRREALDIVTSTRRDMETLIREIKTAQAGRSAIRDAHERIEERREQFERKLAAAKKEPPAEPLPRGDIRAGEWALVGSLGKEGKVLSVDGTRVFLELDGGLRVETAREDLYRPARGGEPRREPSVSWSMESHEAVSGELSVRGLERAEALERVDSFLDRAVLQGLSSVVIIHGIGKGILKRALYDMLRGDPRVAGVRPGEPARGGDGVAVVDLK